MAEHDELLGPLPKGRTYRFCDWPNSAVPPVAAGVYTIWHGDAFLYVGMAGRSLTAERAAAGRPTKRSGLFSRLGSHAGGRRSGDQFCVYVADRLVLPTLSNEDLAAISNGKRSLDALVRTYIHTYLSYRFVVANGGVEARALEAELRRGVLEVGAPAGQVLLRKEQGYLRRTLFGRRDRAACALCGREMPVDLLVAAHIKKRSLCSTAEKRDFANNILPICRMGCDDLFEKGYLFVHKATVRGNPGRAQNATPPVQTYIKSVEGRAVGAWQQGREGYFKAHRAHLGIDT